MGFADQAVAALRQARNEIETSHAQVSALMENVDSLTEHIRVAGDSDVEASMPLLTPIRDGLGQSITFYNQLDQQLESRITRLLNPGS